jgi:hypothetical protein
MFHTSLLLNACVAAALAADQPPVIEIRGEDGAVLIAADQIRSYDWRTQTLQLAPKVASDLHAKLRADGRLVRGVPFQVTLDGQPIYSGKFTSILSSASIDAVCIVLDAPAAAPELPSDRMRIQLGYPGPQFFTGADPRGDERLQAALKAAGMLAQVPAANHNEWIAASLKEMQTIKPGMTRAELLKVFVEEGGLSTRKWRRYAYRDCPYIKVNVEFEPVGNMDERAEQFPQDKITKISTPFLEWSILD